MSRNAWSKKPKKHDKLLLSKRRKLLKSKKESTSNNFIFGVTLAVEKKEERDLTVPKKTWQPLYTLLRQSLSGHTS